MTRPTAKQIKKFYWGGVGKIVETFNGWGIKMLDGSILDIPKQDKLDAIEKVNHFAIFLVSKTTGKVKPYSVGFSDTAETLDHYNVNLYWESNFAHIYD
jgi:hypothetical protein